MILTLAVLQLAGATPFVRSDSIPQVTLGQAIERAARLDPNYVRALGRVDNAEWGRRAARLAFLVPTLTASVEGTKYSIPFFNIGTGGLQSTSFTSRINASYEIFGARKIAALSTTRAEVESAAAGELQQRFLTALGTESSYYDVLANQELLRVGQERLRRAEEQLAVGRAKVLSGAAVQSDSLQLLLEVVRARTELLRLSSALRVAQLQLGRRIGADGPTDAAPLDSTRVAPELPLSLPDAVATALRQGPQYQAARSDERASAAALRSERSGYLPQLTLSAGNTRFDTQFFPNARNVSSATLTLSFPIWNGAQREVAVNQARVNRDVARAIREDLERGARADVTEAYDAYTTARSTIDLSSTGVAAATENFRVQQLRYRSGATDILDLLDAQLRLTQAEADLVQARYAARLALAGLEAMLGTRLFPTQ